MPAPSSLPMSMSVASLGGGTLASRAAQPSSAVSPRRTEGAASDVAGDARALDALRRSAAADPKAAAKEAGRQFEGLFMQELMKGMRKSVGTGALDNAGSTMAVEMLDSQFATRMTGRPGGLGDVIARQLERQMGAAAASSAQSAGASSGAAASVDAAAAPGAAAGAPGGTALSALAAKVNGVAQRQAEFVQRHTASAKAVEAQTGIPANFMVAQAAHESGWGKREIRNADGSSSFNVFGIKAGSNWTGPTATVTTTEYVDGVARKATARFRAYSSYEESFRDYAKLMTESPRYSNVVAHASGSSADSARAASSFAAGLQKAGYATDPAYADKLTRMINTTLRLQRAMT